MAHHESIEVSIIGFNSLVREGICRILSESEFKDHRFFSTYEAACNTTAEVGLAIVDVKSSEGFLHDLAQLKTSLPDARIVLMVDSFDFKQMVEAFHCGIHAYLLKEIGAGPLIDCLRLVNNGEKVLPSILLQHLPNTQMISENQAEVQVQLSELLSEREIDTLRCLVMGYPNKVIAYRLDISEATVKVHVKAILRKLMVQNRTQAAIWAVNQGLVTNAGEFREYRDRVGADVLSPAIIDQITSKAPSLALASSF
ncbi:LuxR C-terminal-related transcriptional regulator [Novosphingobium panipatense]|jgi:two-component system nitrate/nitrite response regulator NarL|uniref:Two component transcriptional regulator, LuxR family n=2 Tax=Novosphingobium panipatense TaxID=428991 RepID=A0ABY1QLI0_9SPHN|nr:response regulator transcription factor [Novosphingobium sp. HII-3]SMP71669.1 two component transcriptional regulator, LuxR family [Novosphingobium panipatense]